MALLCSGCPARRLAFHPCQSFWGFGGPRGPRPGLDSARSRPSSKTFHHPSGPLMHRTGMHGTVPGWQPCPLDCSFSGLTHLLTQLCANSYFLAFEGATHGLTFSSGVVQGLAFLCSCMSQTKQSFYFKLLIAHLHSPSILHSAWRQGPTVDRG